MTRPTFILSKGERKASDTGVHSDELIERYVRAYSSRFTWEGLPKDCPPDFIERQLFFYGAVSAKKVKGLGVCVMGAAPSTLTVYGTPARWLPVGIIGSMNNTSVSKSLWDESDAPVLFDGEPMADRIAPYLELQRKALNALGCNLVGLTSPVMIECVAGSELNGKVIKNNLGAGDVFIPVIDKGALNANVLDLHATDHTANLTGVVHDTDNTMLDMMFIKASMEKASGISDIEASASDQQNISGMAHELQKRQIWAEQINEYLGTSWTVRITYEGDYYAPDGPDTATDRGPKEPINGNETGNTE